MRDKEQLIREMMENYPEASTPSLLCTDWNYKKCRYLFYDEDEDKTYDVDLEKLKKGLDILIKVIADGKYFNNGIVPNLLSEGYDHDANDCDALVQCTIFGEVRYG